MKVQVLITSLLLVLFPLALPTPLLAAFSDALADGQTNYLSPIGYTSFTAGMGTGKGTVVAIIDTGVWQDHPDLKDVLWINSKEVIGNSRDDDGNGYVDDYNGWNFLDNNADISAKDSHGTQLAGIIGAQHNDIGIVGIAPDAKLMTLVACDKSGCRNDAVLKAIRYAVDQGADVILLGLGTSGFVPYTADFDEVFHYAYDHNVVIVAGAGQSDASGTGKIGQNIDVLKVSSASNEPEGANMILAVGALNNPSSDKAIWSNFGNHRVTLWAPGTKILTTAVPTFSSGQNYISENGTPFAAALAAGVAAIMKANLPTLKNYEIIDILTSNDNNILNVQNTNQGKIVCKIPNIEKTVNNGETFILPASHLNPRLTLKMGQKNLKAAMRILDANTIKIDTKLLNLPGGLYAISTTDANLYCTVDNVSITLLGDIPQPQPTPLSVVVPPAPIVSVPKSVPKVEEKLKNSSTTEAISDTKLSLEEKVFGRGGTTTPLVKSLRPLVLIEPQLQNDKKLQENIKLNVDNILTKLYPQDKIESILLTSEDGRPIYKVTLRQQVKLFDIFKSERDRMVLFDASRETAKARGYVRLMDFLYTVVR